MYSKPQFFKKKMNTYIWNNTTHNILGQKIKLTCIIALISSCSDSGLGLELRTLSKDIQVSSNCCLLVQLNSDILNTYYNLIRLFYNRMKINTVHESNLKNTINLISIRLKFNYKNLQYK